MTWVHDAVMAGSAFGVGASVGSFLNVGIWRLPRGESLVRPASRCPHCRAAIAPRDNIPVLSWLLLRGRCRRCAGPVSPRYPLVEVATGLFFALAVLFESSTGPLDLLDRDPRLALGRILYHWTLIALLVVTAMIGYDRYRAPSHTIDSAGTCVASMATQAQPAKFLTAVLVASAACLIADSFGAGLNLALFAVFLCDAAPKA